MPEKSTFSKLSRTARGFRVPEKTSVDVLTGRSILLGLPNWLELPLSEDSRLKTWKKGSAKMNADHQQQSDKKLND